ncbi:Mucin-2 [Aspergillus niger]|nr:Mucin-2 [Aspergillus niger]
MRPFGSFTNPLRIKQRLKLPLTATYRMRTLFHRISAMLSTTTNYTEDSDSGSTTIKANSLKNYPTVDMNMTTNMKALDTMEGLAHPDQHHQLPHRPPTPTPPPASTSASTSIPTPPAPTTTHPPFPFPSPSPFTPHHPQYQQQQQPPPPPPPPLYHFHPPKSVTWGPITEIPIYSPSPSPSPITSTHSSPSTSWIDLSSTTSSTAALASSSTFSPTIPNTSPPTAHPIIHHPLRPIRKPPTQLDNEMFYRNLYHMAQISTLRLSIVYDALSFLGGDFLDQVLLMEEGYLMQVAVMHARQAQQRDFARFSVAAGGGGGSVRGRGGDYNNGGFGVVIPRRPSPVKGGRVEKRKMRKMMKRRKASDVMGADFWEQVNEREEGYEIDEDEDMDRDSV